MSGVDTHRGERHQLTDRKRQWRPNLREQIRAAWSKIDETRGIRHDQLDGTEEIANCVFRAARQAGTREHPSSYVLTTVPQMVKGLGWEPMPGKRATHQRYRNNIHNRLRYLILIGWVESVEPVYKANGEGRGILIRLTPAGVAQSVSAALPRLRDRGASRTARRASCGSSSSGQVAPPLRESSACGDVKSAGSFADVARRAQVARARRRQGPRRTSIAAIAARWAPPSVANKRSRRARGAGAAVSAPAAQGTEQEPSERSLEDRQREAVRRQLALWNEQRGAVRVDAVLLLLAVVVAALLAGWLS
jgi:hypothetical protein